MFFFFLFYKNHKTKKSQQSSNRPALVCASLFSLGWHGQPAGDPGGGAAGGRLRVPPTAVREGDRVSRGKTAVLSSI